jgi:hypothetical protein
LSTSVIAVDGVPVRETGSQDARMHQRGHGKEERLHQQNKRQFRAMDHGSIL